MSEVVLGTAHRGRLNVLVNTVGKSYDQIFREFEGALDPSSVQGSGDVKYHVGATGTHRAPSGAHAAASRWRRTRATSRPSTRSSRAWRAPRATASTTTSADTVLPVLVHGDAAFAGQGVVAETLNLCEVPGYEVGGTVHIVVNNQLGFTTAPELGRSSVYATDVAKMVQAPIFHVNGDDPEACVRVVRARVRVPRRRSTRTSSSTWSATAATATTRATSRRSPSPRMYELIRARAQRPQALHRDAREPRRPHARGGRGDARRLLRRSSTTRSRRPTQSGAADDPGRTSSCPRRSTTAVETGVRARPARARSSTRSSPSPDDFHMHPKLERILRHAVHRRSTPTRSTGRSPRRSRSARSPSRARRCASPARTPGAARSASATACSSTPTPRPSTARSATSTPTRRRSCSTTPCSRSTPRSASSTATRSRTRTRGSAGRRSSATSSTARRSSSTSSSSPPRTSGASSRASRCSSPTASRARAPSTRARGIERFLALCAENNLRVVLPDHRRAVLPRAAPPDPRAARASRSCASRRRSTCGCRHTRSPVDEFDARQLPRDPRRPRRPRSTPATVRRVLLCTGKIAHELMDRRDQLGAPVAVVRVEQLYPWPESQLIELAEKYPAATRCGGSRRSRRTWAPGTTCTGSCTGSCATGPQLAPHRRGRRRRPGERELRRCTTASRSSSSSTRFADLG